ncbi:mitochondrial Lipoyl synthase [Calocera cornea HHB12733]|uniref:Lipoyl synthase, mitochondrial n=1 Tax=Calocera cornea HHB12733 TaxID=1353952 RepID=A0A165CZ75_9BASI|nr:mitochondrial Lipoyl synthase [Calocera cornea HHB12733]
MTVRTAPARPLAHRLTALPRPARPRPPHLARALATPSPSPAGEQSFSARLAAGPTLADFIRSPNPDAALASGITRVLLGRTAHPRLPAHLKTSIPTGSNYTRIKRDLRGLGLNTVCEEARCPNIGTCWGGGAAADGEDAGKRTATATIMLMGSTCTRACRFCSVSTSRAPPPLDPDEPAHTAEAIARWGLGYIVLTSVDRDDLADSGAAHFAQTIASIKRTSPAILVEALTGDFNGVTAHIDRVARAGLDVYAHNLETVERLTPTVRDRRAKYRQSLAVLERAREAGAAVTKTSLMLGVGEEEKEVIQTMRDALSAGISILTLGQYMQPTKRHMKVTRYVAPAEFDHYKREADAMGFLYVASGPLVRSSYRAGEMFVENVLRRRGARGGDQEEGTSRAAAHAHAHAHAAEA